MGFLSARSIFWSNFLFLLASRKEAGASNPDVCDPDHCLDDYRGLCRNSSGESANGFIDAKLPNIPCLLYTTNRLNCSWSFDGLTNESQIVVSISICNIRGPVRVPNYSSLEKVGSHSLIIDERDGLHVTFQYNISLHGRWKFYKFVWEGKDIEVLAPPSNLSASLRDGALLVTWSPPSSPLSNNIDCFQYQLDLGDQGKFKDLNEELSYTEPSVIPGYTYRIRIRTKVTDLCKSFDSWSVWSPVVAVEQSRYQLSIPVIILISLGIPMILLAVLLVLRYQRLSKILFPPIPRPPQKYKNFLERSETLNPFMNAPSSEPVEEEMVTVLDPTGEKPLEDILSPK